tara:strand:- start:1546 stop:3654 length:2109 start_codon:yes stop_codon:yes gene_type:complete
MAVFDENINMTKCSYLLDTYTFADFFADFDGTQQDAKIQFKKIQSYLTIKLTGKTQYAKYKYAKDRTNGRMYGDNSSIQTCIKNVRNFLIDGLTTDIDMINAHPVILYHLCNKYDYECPNLKNIVEHRKETMNRIMEQTAFNYNEVKKLILTATNTNKKIASQSQFVMNYSTEMRAIQKLLLDNKDFNYVKEYAKKDNNFEGSFINHILCIEENIILSHIRTWCELNDLEIHSLFFDGLMVKGLHTDTILLDIEKYILDNYKYEIKLSIKSCATTLVLDEDYEPPKVITYKDVKEKFEKNNCQVADIFVYERNNSIREFKWANFSIFHKGLKFLDDKRKKQDFLKCWSEDEDRRRYTDFGCYPKNCPKDVYNLWKPFDISILPDSEPDEECEKAFTFFLNHVMVLCGYEQKIYDFVMMWLSQMLQYPENKTIELIFLSKEGTGKGLLLAILKTILGNHRIFETTDPQRDVFGNFNGLMKEAFLVCFNESNKSNFYNQNDKKKALITDPTININQKSLPIITCDSYHRFITFTNNSDPSTKNVRRDLFIRCSDDKVGDTEYFMEGFAIAKNKTLCKYIYDELMKYPTKPFINRNDIPETEDDKEFLEATEPHIQRYLKWLCISNKYENSIIYQTTEFLNSYNEFRRDICQLQPANAHKMGADIRFCKLVGVVKGHKDNQRIWTINFSKLREELKINENTIIDV